MNTKLNVQEIYDALLEQRKRLQDFFDSVPDERKYSNAVLFKGTIGSLATNVENASGRLWRSTNA